MQIYQMKFLAEFWLELYWKTKTPQKTMKTWADVILWLLASFVHAYYLENAQSFLIYLSEFISMKITTGSNFFLKKDSLLIVLMLELGLSTI